MFAYSAFKFGEFHVRLWFSVFTYSFLNPLTCSKICLRNSKTYRLKVVHLPSAQFGLVMVDFLVNQPRGLTPPIILCVTYMSSGAACKLQRTWDLDPQFYDYWVPSLQSAYIAIKRHRQLRCTVSTLYLPHFQRSSF